MPGRQALRPPQHTTILVYIAIQIAVLSFLSSYYNYGLSNATVWVMDKLDEYEYTRDKLDWIREFYEEAKDNMRLAKRTTTADLEDSVIEAHVKLDGSSDKQIFTAEQLSLYDGTRTSKSVYLAIMGRVYNVDKGKKHYGKGGSYHFFAGRDATRAFVTGEFNENGLTDDTNGLSHDDLLGIRDWVSFYDKDYVLIGVVVGRYYDSTGKPTEELHDALARMDRAAEWRKAKTDEQQVFPPCNSEWHQNSGGRVWCTTKSGGVSREWAGVPRLLFDHNTKSTRCACVKNFGDGLSAQGKAAKVNRGDLDHPDLKLYDNCSPTSNSCRIEE